MGVATTENGKSRISLLDPPSVRHRAGYQKSTRNRKTLPRVFGTESRSLTCLQPFHFAGTTIVLYYLKPLLDPKSRVPHTIDPKSRVPHLDPNLGYRTINCTGWETETLCQDVSDDSWFRRPEGPRRHESQPRVNESFYLQNIFY
jgi:hypothetical protein